MCLSILILTLNEEQNLPACLESVKWSDDIVVLDSFSNDRTVEIARAHGVRVIQRRFDDFASQRNYAMEHISFRYPWIFHLDADERFTVALREECMITVNADKFSGFMVPSKLLLGDRWLRYSGMYPTYQVRLLKLGEVRFVQKGHGQREEETKRGIGYLKEPYPHYNFSKGIEDWREKHRRYADQEALETWLSLRGGRMDWEGLASITDPIRRRRALKLLSMRLPCRGSLRFIYMYFFRLGFLDGWPGLAYCRMMTWYENLIARKVRELGEKNG